MVDDFQNLSSNRSSPLIGQQIGNYLLEGLLGVGGMGQVFQARHVRMGRVVAFKLMHSSLAQDPQFKARFRQEAMSAAALRHAHIVEVFDFDEQDGFAYLVMELITRGSLSRLLRGDTQMDPSWSLGRGLELVQQAADALAYAHALDMIHRDIKPDNLLLQQATPETQIILKVADFGLARIGEGSGLTAANTVMGTPAYMSPEQCQGHELDGHSDVYALGVVLFEIATGTLPFPVQTISEAVFKHVYTPPPTPRSIRAELPDSLETLILRCLAKLPDDRPTAMELAARLRTLVGTTGAAASVIYSLAPQGGDATSYQPVEHAAVPAVRTVMGSQSHLPQIQVLDTTGLLLQIIAIPSGGLTIGRMAGNDLTLDDPSVSRNHTRVEWDGHQVLILDLGSRSGTQLGETMLPPNEASAWPWRAVARVGPFWLRLDPPTAPIKQTVGARTDAVPAHAAIGITHSSHAHMSGLQTSAFGTVGRVVLALEPEALTLTPGCPITIEVMLANPRAEPEQVRVQVEGVGGSWVRQPPLIYLAPNGQAQLKLTIEVPETGEVAAGAYAVPIRAISQSHPDDRSEVLAHWTVAPQARGALSIAPSRQSGRGPGQFRVHLQNMGNASLTYQVSADDEGGTGGLALDCEQVTIAVQGHAEIGLRVGGTVRLMGAPHQRRILVQAHLLGSSGPDLTAEAVYIQGALLPIWAGVVILMLALFGIGGVWANAGSTNRPLLADLPTPVTTADQGAQTPRLELPVLQTIADAPTLVKPLATSTPEAAELAVRTLIAEATVQSLTQTVRALIASEITPLLPVTSATEPLPPPAPITTPLLTDASPTLLTTQANNPTASLPLDATSTPLPAISSPIPATSLPTSTPPANPTDTAILLPTSLPTSTPPANPTDTAILLPTSLPASTPPANPTDTAILLPTSLPTSTPQVTAIKIATVSSISLPMNTSIVPNLLLTYRPNPYTFGNVPAGQRTVSSAIMVTNRSNVRVRITGHDATGVFLLEQLKTTCGRVELAPDATCQVFVIALPGSPGLENGTITLSAVSVSPLSPAASFTLVVTANATF